MKRSMQPQQLQGWVRLLSNVGHSNTSGLCNTHTHKKGEWPETFSFFFPFKQFQYTVNVFCLFSIYRENRTNNDRNRNGTYFQNIQHPSKNEKKNHLFFF